MYKKYLLRCQTINHYTGCWENREYYFDTKDEMMNYIKNGDEYGYTKPEDIKVEAAFELKRVWL